MSGIISDPAFNDMFTATKGDNTMQATVTAVYEVGKYNNSPGIPRTAKLTSHFYRLFIRSNCRAMLR